jgi:type I restriction enzyme S subunit
MQRLGKITHSFSGGTPSKSNSAFWQGNIGWLSPKDIKSFFISEASDQVSLEAVKQSATQIAPIGTVVLVARSGILAHTLPVAILQQPLAINQDIKALVVRDIEVILPEYLGTYLALFGKRLLPIITKHGNTVHSVETGDLNGLHIPIPPMERQVAIVGAFKDALDESTIQEQQAQALLAGLDAFLLGELGVELLPLHKVVRPFYRGWPELRLAQRWDPLFHEGDVFAHLAQGRYPSVYLNSLLRSCKNGFAAGRGDQDLLNQGVIQIRPTNMNERRELDFSRNVYVSADLLQKQPFDILRPGEVLFNNTNSQELVGKTVFFDLPGQYFCSNHLTRLRLADALHPEYLTYLFNAYQRRQVFYRLCVNWNNQSGINAEALRRIMIPLPPLSMQTALVAELNSRKQQALRQSAQAQADFAAAKQHIEQLILA